VKGTRFTVQLFLPAQAAAETEATILSWKVAPGAAFEKGALLAEAESAKAAFPFEAPCAGTVVKLLAGEGDTVALDKPVLEIETADAAMRTAQSGPQAPAAGPEMTVLPADTAPHLLPAIREVSILGIAGYLPERIVPNSELLREFPDITDDYLFGVTGIRRRHWARPDEKPSDMAYQAAVRAIEKSGLKPSDIEMIIVATTTPDVVMPSTACVLQEKLGVWGIPAFDINAACSGWLYGLSVARGLVLSGIAGNVLVASVDLQSRLLDKKDKGTYFLFGDGAGAAVVSGKIRGHVIKTDIMIADARGLSMARRRYPGYYLPGPQDEIDPYVRVDGHSLFRFATASFATVIADIIVKSGWKASQVRWVIPHQANGRILKAVAAKSEIPFERIYLNIDRVGNTSSASIPNALTDIEMGLQKGDKVLFCSVGAGITAAAMSVEW